VQASVKRRSALWEHNRPRDNRGAWLQTRSQTARPCNTAWPLSTNSGQKILVGECLMPQKLPQEVRPKAAASEDGPEGAGLQACLIACNLRHCDAVPNFRAFGVSRKRQRP
jgi:hypothetical protein